ncbi:hypothetical protein [Amycolatopsis sp. WQ 127309]|uniref:hypothetical protein n=1 Tax=Amycolatopsis sp. WQ 127309 TaxID=2932773 RepID=UPI001FF18AF5|nr:hypothetical protein [Amycolatopsis sp. WQ 127309]UOZ11235.1 hypothetical protein MUY22_24395 [Amycolatopsis sp. WQ 127309]
MGLRRGRAALVAASVLVGLVAVAALVLALVAGEPYMPLVVPFAALSALCAGWARRLGRRYAAATGVVPPGWDDVDLDVQTTRVRALGLRATGLAVLWAVVTVAAGVGAAVVLTRSDTDSPPEIAAATPLVIIVFALMGFGFSVAAAVSWRRRHRAVTASGWRPATATVTHGSGPCTVILTLDDDTRIRTQSLSSTHGAANMTDFPGTPVRFGGADRSMVVLFPRGLFRNGPYAVPVRSLEPKPGARPTARS